MNSDEDTQEDEHTGLEFEKPSLNKHFIYGEGKMTYNKTHTGGLIYD